MRLILANGWTVARQARHRLWMEKETGQGLLKMTIKNNHRVIVQNTLLQILGSTQTGLVQSASTA